MRKNTIAEAIAVIAERERDLAVEEGDYVLALICAFVEYQAREAAARS